MKNIVKQNSRKHHLKYTALPRIFCETIMEMETSISRDHSNELSSFPSLAFPCITLHCIVLYLFTSCNWMRVSQFHTHVEIEPLHLQLLEGSSVNAEWAIACDRSSGTLDVTMICNRWESHNSTSDPWSPTSTTLHAIPWWAPMGITVTLHYLG